MGSRSLAAADRSALEALAGDLGRVFGPRLHSVVAYGLEAPAEPRAVHSLALVERLAFEDLAACVPLVSGWQKRGLAVPLLLEREEFRRTLDVFPLEYGEIIASHVVIVGASPLDGVTVSARDTRRACELRAKSLLIHLREGYLETRGDAGAVARLVAASAAPWRALLANIARLGDDPDPDVAATAERQIGIPAALVRDVMSAGAGAQDTIADPTALLSRYIAALERVWEYTDTWRE